MTAPYFADPDPTPTPQTLSVHVIPQESLSTVTIDCDDRWQVYHRLQELGIDCQCKGFQPLTVTIQTPTDAIQLWSVVRRVCQSRQQLAAALTQSWRLPYTH